MTDDRDPLLECADREIEETEPPPGLERPRAIFLALFLLIVAVVLIGFFLAQGV